MGYWPEHKIYFCPSCNESNGYEIEITRCKKCNTPLIRECPKCKKDIKTETSLCPYCGAEYCPQV